MTSPFSSARQVAGFVVPMRITRWYPAKARRALRPRVSAPVVRQVAARFRERDFVDDDVAGREGSA